MVIYVLQTHWVMCRKLRAGKQTEAVNYFKIIQRCTKPLPVVMKAIRIALQGLS